MKPAVLLVAGHVNIEGITNEGACPDRDFTSLRGSTGAHGEREWTGTFVGLLADALRLDGQVEPVITDAIYHPDVYARPYDLCLINHYHRDAPTERAMFAAPDPVMSGLWVTDAAAMQADRFVARLAGGYAAATGIPVTEPLVTLNMTQIYTYCYVERGTPPVVCEWGNANLDFVTLYELGIARIVRYARNCILEHLNLIVTGSPPVARRASDIPLPPPPIPALPVGVPPGTHFFGMAPDGATVGWTYPDGSTHWFIGGLEAGGAKASAAQLRVIAANLDALP